MRKHVSKPGEGFVAAGMVRAMLEQIADIGRGPDEVLREAMVPFTYAELSEGKLEQVSRSGAIAIYRQCILIHATYAAQQDQIPLLPPGEVHLICQCMISCGTLLEAIERCCEFFRYRDLQIAEVNLHSRGEVAEFSMRTCRRVTSVSGFLADACGLMSMSQLFGWLVGFPLDLDRVTFAYPEAYREELLLKPDGCPLDFGCRNSSLLFSSSLLQLPVVRTPQELKVFLKSFPYYVLPPDYGARRLGDQIRTAYRIALLRRARLPTLAALAEVNGLSAATFRRRLADEGVSLLAVREECRRAITFDLLRHSRFTIQEISERAGFGEANTFREAFRKWTGQTPSEFRRLAPQPAVDQRYSSSSWSPGRLATISTHLRGEVSTGLHEEKGTLLSRGSLLICMELAEGTATVTELQEKLVPIDPAVLRSAIRRLLEGDLLAESWTSPLQEPGLTLTTRGRGFLEAGYPIAAWLTAHADRADADYPVPAEAAG